MQAKYNRLDVIYIARITNKTYFRNCALFPILDLLRIDPTSFGGGGGRGGEGLQKSRYLQLLGLVRKRVISCKFG